jgi:serine/threonine protein kinase
MNDKTHPSDANVPAGAGSVRVGDVLRNRYVLEERLGSGDRGTVFKALDRYRADLPEDDRYVAIKVLRPGADALADVAADLRREFYCTQFLSHENIVNVYELDRDGDIDFFTMEYLEGELLSGVMARLQPLPMSRPQAWAIIREIGSGLAHAHSRNVVHGDLKPQNILITHSGEVRILDFGASRHDTAGFSETAGQQRTGINPSTSSYASCELLAGRVPDPRDDVYALACLAYELLAGAHPFQRRPATEARDLGIVPKRPPGLTRQQWQTIAMGLSWHRAGRSIAIRAFLDKLNPGRAAERRMPGVHALQATPVQHSQATSLRATTLFAVLLITVGVWVSFVRFESRGGATGGDAITEAATTQAGPAPAGGGPPAETTPTPTPEEQAAQPAEPQAKPSTDRGHDAGVSKKASAPARPLVVSVSNTMVRAGEHFAEIRVHRSPALRRGADFVWWTESASAKPGIDYVHQGKVVQSFPKGKSSTSFFVKLVPTASRARREVFYVAIAEAGRGASAEPVARAAVWLPTNQDREPVASVRDEHAESHFSTAALGASISSSK